MDRGRRQGRRGRARRYKIPLPRVCYIFILGEAFFFSAWVIIRYVAMLYPPTRCYDNIPYNILFYRMSMIVGGFAGLTLCCLAEACWGKYAFLYIFTGVSIPSAITCWLIIPKILQSSIHDYLCKSLFFTIPLFTASYPLRIAMISLQLPLPQHKKNVRKFYFYHWTTSYLFLALISIASFRGYESKTVRFWRGTIVGAVVPLCLIGYLLSFAIIRKRLVKLFRKKGIVTNEIKCLGYALRYAFKNNWLEYTADKCSVETIENTTQALNMMMVFTSFMLYYAHDQHLEYHFAEINTMSAKMAIFKYAFFSDVYYILTAIFLVLVEKVMLPAIRKLKIKTSVLKLIGAGIAFQATSMVIAHALQNSFEDVRSPEREKGQLRIYNAVDYGTMVETKWDRLMIERSSLYRNNEILVAGRDTSYLKIYNFQVGLFINTEIEVIEGESVSYIVTPRRFYRLKDKNPKLRRIEEVHEISDPMLFFICPFETGERLYAWCNATVLLRGETGKEFKYSIIRKLDGSYTSVPLGKYDVSVTIHGNFAYSNKSQSIDLAEGGMYSILIYEAYSNFKIAFKILTQLEPFIASSWVWSMIIIRAIGTALAAVSSYTFTFIQAPPDMRTTLWGLHFFFENVGNLILIAISLFKVSFYRDVVVAVILGISSLVIHIVTSSHFQYVNYYIF